VGDSVVWLERGETERWAIVLCCERGERLSGGRYCCVFKQGRI